MADIADDPLFKDIAPAEETAPVTVPTDIADDPLFKEFSVEEAPVQGPMPDDDPLFQGLQEQADAQYSELLLSGDAPDQDRIPSSIVKTGADAVASGTYGLSSSLYRVPETIGRAADFLVGLPGIKDINEFLGMHDLGAELGINAEGTFAEAIQRGVEIGGETYGPTQSAERLSKRRAQLYGEVDHYNEVADEAFDRALEGNFEPLGEVLTDPRALVSFVGQAVPSLAMMLATGGNLGAIAIMEGMEVSADAAEFEAHTGMKVDPDQFMAALAQATSLNTVAEKFGLNKILGSRGVMGAINAGLSEMSTEAFQAFNTNLAIWAQYNREKSLTGGILPGAIGGLGAGLGGGAASSALGPGTEASSDFNKDLMAEFEELMKNKDYENAQKFLPLVLERIQENITAAAEEDVDSAYDLQQQGLYRGTNGNLADVPFAPVNEADSATWWDSAAVVNPETGVIETAREHDFEAAPVVATQETFYNNKIKEAEFVQQLAEAEAQNLELQVIELMAQGAEPVAITMAEDELANVEASIQTAKDNIAQLEFQRGQEFNYSNKAVSMLTEWVQALVPDMKVVFSTGHAGEVMAGLRNNPTFNTKEGGAGLHWELADGTTVVDVNLDAFLGINNSVREDVWVEALTHEFGHALITHTYRGQSQETKVALKKAYSKWLKKLLTSKNVEEYYRHRFPPNYAKAYAGSHGQDALDSDVLDQWVPRENREYDWGMDEWTANQMAKMLQTNETVSGPVGKFFKDLIAKLKEFFKLTEGKYAAVDTFQDFVDMLATKVLVGDLAKVQNADTLTQQEAGREALRRVDSIAKRLGLKAPKGKIPPDVRFPHEESNMNGDIDKYGFFSKWAMTLLQLADRNPHISGLRKYVTNVRSWWTDKMKFIARADDRLMTWRKLGDKRAAAVGAFMQDLTVLSYDEGKRFEAGTTEFDKLVRKHGLDDEQLELVAAIESDFTAVLDELYSVLLADAQKTLDPIDQGRSVDKLNKDFEALRQRNFYPLSRFGEYYMRVKAKTDMVFEGKEYKEGDVITFEMFEGGALFTNFSMDTPPALKKREARFRNNDLFEVASGVVNDTQREFAGLPPQLLEMMRDRLDLTEIQRKELDNLLRDIAPGRSFTKHMKTRKNVGGYSSDSLRAYADYFQHFANYVARIKYKGELQNNINEVTDSANVIAQKTGNSVKRGRIGQFMQDHFEYVMNPDNEWANLRSFGFLWYLGFVPKSAVINLTQTGLVTQPFLGARFGDIAAARALTSATKSAFQAMRSEKRGLRPDQDRLIDYLIDTGIIEESMATELAAIAEGRSFARTATNTLFGSQKLGSTLRNAAGYGAWMFQTAEKFNRRITALAAYELVQKKGIPVRDQNGKLTGEFRPATEKEAFLFAQQTVEGTQFEYARFNRPRFMQGKKSVFFLFWQYMQNMLYFTGNDPGAARYIMIMMMAAGLSGLPFSEDLMDIIDFLSKKLNKHFETDDFTSINIRNSLRSTIAELGANPDLVMHGASRYTMGLPFLADAVGLPMPMVDVSGSLSMGRIIPGIESLTRSDTPMRGDLGRAAEAAGGAVMNIPLNLMYAIADDNPDTWRRWEKAAPTIVQHMSKAMRYSIRGEATTPEGAVIKDFHVPDDKMDNAQVIFQAAGFADTEINRAQEEHYMKKDMIAYYELRKRLYLDEAAFYHRNGDKKEFQVILKDIRQFNGHLRRAGLGALAIGPATIRRSITDRVKKRRYIELGIPGGKKGVQVSRDVEEGFTEEPIQ